MKFSCSRDELQSALNTTKHGVASRTTMQVLEGILFNVDNQTLHLTATDLKIGISTEIPVDAQEDGAVVLNATLITNVIQRLPGDTVYFSSDDKNRVTVECLNSEFVINGLPADEFPEFPEIDKNFSFTVEADDFKKLIDSTRFATASNDNMPIITGLKMEVEGERISMIACDGFRLALRNSELKDSLKVDDEDNKMEMYSVVIPGKSMSEMSSLLSSVKEPVTISFSKSQIFFIIGKTIFYSRLLEGDFIDYKGIFPSETTTNFIVNKDELLRCCERASLIANQGTNNLVKMTINSGKLTVASNSDQGEVQDVIDIENAGEDLKIAFNSKFFIDALKAISDKEIKIGMTTSVGPAEVQPIEGNDYSYLILPVRLAEA